MALFNELLHRVGRRGVYGIGSGSDHVSKWDCSVSARAWRAWAEAHAAFDRHDFGEASRWLNVAQSWAGEALSVALRAEVALLWAHILEAADEPRRAMPHAREAWTMWFGLARNPLAALEGDTLTSLLEALTYPEKTQLPREQLFIEWMTDRASPNLHYSAQKVFDACRGVGDSAPALELTKEWRAWYRTTSAAGGITATQLAPLEAKLVRDVANLQDQLGDPQAALEGFEEARAILTAPGVKADPFELRQLDFNIGNQQAKLGRHKPAIAAFERAALGFEESGDEEPAIRARHAALVSRWSLGESPEKLLPGLETLLCGYERVINDGKNSGGETAAAQNLRQGNRLWLSLASRELSEKIDHDRFLHQVFASREGNTRSHTIWQSALSGKRKSADVIDQISVLLARLQYQDNGLLIFSLESGVHELFAITLVGGRSPLSQRLVVERFSTDCVTALEGLIRQRREANMNIASRAVPATAKAEDAFVNACSRLWCELPPKTRQRLHSAANVYFLPDPDGVLDETPLELLHDGQSYLGLRVPIVRTASWAQMARVLAPNFVDRAPCGRFAVVRGAEAEALGQLPQADDEVRKVEAVAREQFADVQKIVEPAVGNFSELLDRGLDVLHFTGHSYADDAGEYLFLRRDERAGVPEVGRHRRQAAPISIFCSCLVGLHRRTRSGLARGIATAILDTGGAAVVAAMVPLPDQVGHDFALALHHHAKSQPLGEAVQAARQTLSRRFHPATWGCFALFGRHNARLIADVETAPLQWPALLTRCFATRGALWREELEEALAGDAKLLAPLAAQVPALIDCYVNAKRGAKVPKLKSDLVNSLAADGRVSLLVAEALTNAVCSDDGEHARKELSRALLMAEITDDTYVLVAVADAAIRGRLLEVQDSSGTSLVNRAEVFHGWLSRSASGLREAREALEKTKKQWGQRLTLQVREMADVSPEVFAAADSGDRNAMKDMVWNLKSREASPAALASNLPWTHWLYRMMGADGDGPMSDFCGVVDAAARSGKLQSIQAGALRTLFKRFIGPGEIEPEHISTALKAFAGDPSALVAIRQFQLYDRVVSQEHEVSQSDIERAQTEATLAGAFGLAAFWRLQISARALAAGNFSKALERTEAELATLLKLNEADNAYASRANRCAAFLYNITQASGDAARQAQVLRQYRRRIEAFIEEQNKQGQTEDA